MLKGTYKEREAARDLLDSGETQLINNAEVYALQERIDKLIHKGGAKLMKEENRLAILDAIGSSYNALTALVGRDPYYDERYPNERRDSESSMTISTE